MITPLYNHHRNLGAKLIDFHGWSMPLEYSSIREECLAVRESCGLFDVSHMGRFILRGADVREKLNYLTTNDLGKLHMGRVQYNLLTNQKGGVIDDITVYMLSEDELLLCVNASNREKVIKHLSSYMKVEDISDRTLQLAIQGKKAQHVLSEYYDVSYIGYYHFKTFGDVIISRTGYTGEDGFEVYLPVEEGIRLFEELVKEVKPCGLGARDVLRIEAGLPLYGHELSEDITPLEANLERFVSLQKDFLGKEELLRRDVKRKLFGLEFLERGVPREGYRILLEGKEIGRVSSGTYSHFLGKGIALCFVDVDYRKEGLEVELEVRGKRLKALLRRYPFIKK